MTPIRPLAAIIPAAGLSSRMGRYKPLLPLDQATVIAATINSFKDIGGLDIIVVVGHRKQDLIPALRRKPVRIIENIDYLQGMFSSIAAGVAQLAPDCHAFFVLPADIALVRPATLLQLADACDAHPGHIIYPVFRQKRGHPPLIPADLAPEIGRWRQNGGLKAFLNHHPRAAIELPVADRHIHLDMDTYEDYLRINEAWKRRDIPTLAECEEILTVIHPVSDRVLRHCRQTARVATAICQALTTAGVHLDPDMVQAGALLHDLAKGSKDHALAGEKLIRTMGFPGIGLIVGAHTDLLVDECSPITETEVVHLADKLVKEDRLIPLSAKFEYPLKRWADDPAAMVHVLRRRRAAFLLKEKVEAIIGISLEKVLSGGDNQVQV